MKVSVVIPAYNEVKTIEEVVAEVNKSLADKEIIVIDDCSTDGTREKLKSLERDYKDMKVFYHDRNRGKGAALRTGFSAVTGDAVIVQDADLEYSPLDYPRLLEPMIKEDASVVYGSRFLNNTRKDFFFWQYIGNRFLTFLCNVVNGTSLSDMATCYKVFKSRALKDITLKSDGFGFCPEFTAKLAKKGIKIREVPIRYKCRNRSDGKKLTWKDAFVHICAIFWFRFFD